MKFIVLLFCLLSLYSCVSENELIDSSDLFISNYSQKNMSNVVWEVEPGNLNVPRGQTVTINKDGTIIYE